MTLTILANVAGWVCLWLAWQDDLTDAETVEDVHRRADFSMLLVFMAMGFFTVAPLLWRAE